MSKGYIMTSSNKCLQGGNRGNISTEETPPLTHCILVSCLLQASYGCYKNYASLHCTLSLQSVTDRSQEDPRVPGRRSRMQDPIQLYFTTSLSAEVSCHCMVTLIQSSL